MLRMCRGLRINKQQEDKPELIFASSEALNAFVGYSNFSVNTFIDSGISSSER